MSSQEVQKVLTARSGRVLGKGTIVKADHFRSGHQRSSLPFRLAGAPNFRQVAALPISGVAQPSLHGIRAVLNRCSTTTPYSSRSRASQPSTPPATPATTIPTVLSATLSSGSGSHESASDASCRREGVLWISLREECIVYINGRPFVLREVENPLLNVGAYSGLSVGTLEDMEARLKQDLLDEAARYGGNVLVHDEIDDEKASPVWEAITPTSVMTPKEVFESLATEGYKISYARVPITPENAPNAKAFNAVVDALKVVDDMYHIVFNCQMGRGRSTMGMVVATLMYLWMKVVHHPSSSPSSSASSTSSATVTDSDGHLAVREKTMPLKVKSLDRFRAFLDAFNVSWKKKGLRMAQVDGLTAYREGEYRAVMALVRTLRHGLETKQEVDLAIDLCDLLQNLREIILDYRTRHERARTPEESTTYLSQAAAYLKRYVYILVFNSYLAEQAPAFQMTFRQWLKPRIEVRSIIDSIDKEPEEALRAPSIHASLTRSLESMPTTTASSTSTSTTSVSELEGKGKEISSEESRAVTGGTDVEDALVKNRRGNVLGVGMIIKADHFHRSREQQVDSRNSPVVQIEGAINFRTVPGYDNVHGVGQTTVQGARGVFKHVVTRHQQNTGSTEPVDIIWINLREEPLVYLNGKPYALREATHPFRNLGTFEGIATDRLTEMESRLKKDCLREFNEYGAVLTHDETEMHQVVSHWERIGLDDADSVAVHTPCEIFENVCSRRGACVDGLGLIHYHRVPVTPERSPEERDFTDLVKILWEAKLDEGSNTHMVINCQSGVGRSTTGMVTAILMQMWKRIRSASGAFKRSSDLANSALRRNRRGEFGAILNLVRTLPEGQLLKQQVDEAIDTCGALVNLRDIISQPPKAKQSLDRSHAQTRELRKLHFLERYFYLVLFNGYLSNQIFEDFKVDFAEWVKNRSEVTTLKHQLHSQPQTALRLADPMATTIPLLTPTTTTTTTTGVVDVSDPVHHPHPETETPAFLEKKVILDRTGNVLVSNTILKADHFPGCQRKGLLPRLNGAPNYRKVDGANVYGVAQCTTEGIVNVLQHIVGEVDRGQTTNTVFWTNLREEPIVYVNSRPFVVRQQDLPFANLEITGIEPSEVEAMETRLKEDVLCDAAKYGGRIMLHDETDDGKVIAVWEPVTSDTVLTLREAYESVKARGFRVEYARIPITDERAPEEKDFNELVRRLRKATPNDHIVFNCQMGRGRTTTGMVVACLHAIDVGALVPPPEIVPAEPPTTLANKSVDTSDGSKEQLGIQYHQGDFKIILRAVRVLDKGTECKLQVDYAIDSCSVMQNLRHTVREYKAKAEECRLAGNVPAYEANFKRARDFLERYYYLLAFNAYMNAVHPTRPSEAKAVADAAASASTTTVRLFDEWLKERKELKSLLKELTLD